jgi:putative holliday junction resolvase
MTRLLGIDLGERRIGIAIGEDDGSGARPLETIRRGRSGLDDARALAALAARTGATELVVGLPLEASGDEGPQARVTLAWVEAIRRDLSLPVTLRDERLSSQLAETRLGSMKRGRSGGPPTRTQRDGYRARVDREAAAIILQDELDVRAGAAHPTASGDAPTLGASVVGDPAPPAVSQPHSHDERAGPDAHDKSSMESHA